MPSRSCQDRWSGQSEAIRFLKSQGLKVVIANVLMGSNFFDNAGVMALAKELGVSFTLDPTITPKMDGDTSIVALRIRGVRAEASFPQRGSGGQCRRILRSAASAGRRYYGRIAVQRRSHRLLHFSLW